MLNRSLYRLPASHRLTVTGVAYVEQEESGAGEQVSGSETFGPFMLDRTYMVRHQGNATVSISEVIPALMPVVGNVGDLVEMVGSAAPTASAQAELDVNPTGDDNGLTFTAVAYGTDGNAISIAYVDPEANDATLSVSVSGTAISVSLATDETGDITSTAAEVLAAIEAHARADELVTVAIDASDSGAGDDGSGIVTAMAAANLAGGAGTGIGVAGPGSRYTDIDGPTLYINTGTKAQPIWVALAEVS